MTEVESFKLRTDRRYLQYIPDMNIPISVYRYELGQWLTMTPSLGLNILDKNTYAYIEDLSCIIFHPSLLNSEIKIEYEHSGIKNPFLIHETLDLVEHLKELGKFQISGSIYFEKSIKDKYILTLNGGSFIYNGNFYIIPKQDINFRRLGLPTIISQYYGYLFYIGSDTIDHNLYFPLKQVNPSIVRTNFVYKQDQLYQAKSELLQQARGKSLKPDDKILEVAYVFCTIAKDKDSYTMLYIVDYPTTYRKI